MVVLDMRSQTRARALARLRVSENVVFISCESHVVTIVFSLLAQRERAPNHGFALMSKERHTHVLTHACLSRTQIQSTARI